MPYRPQDFNTSFWQYDAHHIDVSGTIATPLAVDTGPQQSGCFWFAAVQVDSQSFDRHSAAATLWFIARRGVRHLPFLSVWRPTGLGWFGIVGSCLLLPGRDPLPPPSEFSD